MKRLEVRDLWTILSLPGLALAVGACNSEGRLELGTIDCSGNKSQVVTATVPDLSPGQKVIFGDNHNSISVGPEGSLELRERDWALSIETATAVIKDPENQFRVEDKGVRFDIQLQDNKDLVITQSCVPSE